VQVDRLAFEQILTNLVDKAAKFSPEGAPIEVLLRSSEGGALLSVRDRGPGLTAEEKARLFERFRKGPCREKRTGLGLGLFIVKGFVEAHGGHVAVDSEPGRGSTFHVWLPGPQPVIAGC
jgi:signal transduction histidine kinase